MMPLPLTRFLAGTAATLLLSANTAALAGSPALGTTVQVLCAANVDQRMCLALQAALALRWPDHKVALGEAKSPSDWIIRFEQDGSGAHWLSGHLVWQAANGAANAGPKLEISVMDQGLHAAAFDQFANDLITLSGLPL